LKDLQVAGYVLGNFPLCVSKMSFSIIECLECSQFFDYNLIHASILY